MHRLVALLPFVLVACVDSGDKGMVIVNNAAVSDSCVLTSNPDGAQRGHGTIYSGSPDAYVMTPVIQSRITTTDNVDTVSRTIQLRGADVKLTLKAVTIEAGGNFTTTNPNKAYPPFSLFFSGSLPPGGFASAFVDLIPPSVLRDIHGMGGTNKIDGEVLAEIVIKGELPGGDGVETDPYFYPVNVCNDCVVVNLGVCPLPMTIMPRGGNACNAFQDGNVDCCTDASNNLVCPAIVATM